MFLMEPNSLNFMHITVYFKHKITRNYTLVNFSVKEFDNQKFTWENRIYSTKCLEVYKSRFEMEMFLTTATDLHVLHCQKITGYSFWFDLISNLGSIQIWCGKKSRVCSNYGHDLIHNRCHQCSKTVHPQILIL